MAIPSQPSRRPSPPSRGWIKIAQWVFMLLIVVFAVRGMAGQWTNVRSDVRVQMANLDVAWVPIIVASLIVLGVYGVLIETWRRMLSAWNERMPRIEATRIWFASALGKYLPGYIWSLTAMGMMAREQGTSPIAAAGSSVIVNVLNIVTGIGLSLLCVSHRFSQPWLVIATDVAGLVVVVTILLVPKYLAPVVRLISRVTGRTLELPHATPGTIIFTLVATTIAWIGYGIAFELFANGVLHQGQSATFALSSPLLFIGLYAGAYILGLLSPIPSGVGAREFVLIGSFTELGMMSASGAAIVVVLSRVWLTVLEVVPGFVSLFINQTKTHSRSA